MEAAAEDQRYRPEILRGSESNGRYHFGMDNLVTEVPLRKRSTPYRFRVAVTQDGRTLKVYDGGSPNSARSAYWQAVHTLAFVKMQARVEMFVTLSNDPYGSFLTETGTKTLHVPSGDCVKWMSGSWSGDHLHEKMLATIPGMPGPYTP